MDALGAIVATLISLAFLGILGLVAAVAIPGMFLPLVAPLLDRLVPARQRRS
ncbi:MAG TPA: hypothetical protein VNK50_06065 [Calidithermus sp.]|jgi:hypothetical protein|nr:hypothetical protein [Calidithermus sp.]